MVFVVGRNYREMGEAVKIGWVPNADWWYGGITIDQNLLRVLQEEGDPVSLSRAVPNGLLELSLCWLTEANSLCTAIIIN